RPSAAARWEVNSLRSCPAEKALPCAASTTARMRFSVARLSSSCDRASSIASDKLLRACGRLSVRTAMWPIFSRSTTGSFAAAGALARVEDWAFMGLRFRAPRPRPSTSRGGRAGQAAAEHGLRRRVKAPGRSLATWWRDGEENSCIEEKRRAQAPRRTAQRLVATRGADRPPALVAARDRTQRCADPRQGRVHIARSQADCGIVETVGRKKHAPGKPAPSLRALPAPLPTQSFRPEPSP